MYWLALNLASGLIKQEAKGQGGKNRGTVNVYKSDGRLCMDI